MRRILFAAAMTLAAISSVQPVFAKISSNKITTNGTSLNGTSLNGTSLNTISTNSVAGSVDDVTSIVLPSGEIIQQ
jgi:hypothetical protein